MFRNESGDNIVDQMAIEFHATNCKPRFDSVYAGWFAIREFRLHGRSSQRAEFAIEIANTERIGKDCKMSLASPRGAYRQQK